MSSHNSIPVPMGSDSSGPRRRRRKQRRPKGRPSAVRRRTWRDERRETQRRFDAAADAHATALNGEARVIAEDLVDRCRTPGERRAAAILGAELWRKQVTKVVLSIADKVEGIVNMAGSELAELGQKLEALTMRVRRLELSELAAEAQRERDAKRKRKRTLASKRRKARNRARKVKS